MTRREFEERIARATEPRGAGRLALRVAGWTVEFSGLDPAVREGLRARWGPFADSTRDGATVRVRVRDAGDEPWVPSPPEGEHYRLQALPGTGTPPVVSYAFGLAPSGEGGFVAALARSERESAERSLDNVARVVVARLAASEGGLALHGAGVLRDGRAWIFAGPSRAGKSTAVRLSYPAPSLGDDFAVLARRGEGWVAAAVPFDNSESVPADRPTGTFPLAGVFRLVHAPHARIERLAGARAAASVLSTAAFPWAVPDLADRLAASADGLVRAGKFALLHLREDPDFWRLLDAPATTP